MRTLIAVTLIMFLAAPLLAQSMDEGATGAKPAKPKATKKTGKPTAKPDLGLKGGRYPHVSPDGKLIAFAIYGDLWVVPVEGGITTWIPTGVGDGYIPRAGWLPAGDEVWFQVLNRDQTRLELRAAVPGSGSSRLVVAEAVAVE